MQLLVVDTTGIQPYIFGSNRLRENFGASHLVAQATEGWALEVVRSFRSNVRADFSLNDALRIEDTAQNLEAEVVYAGGGNIVIIFRNEATDDAKAFIGKLSRKIMTNAPNLQLVIAQQQFEWDESLYKAIKTAFKKLAEMKRTRSLSAPLLGLSASVMCQSTGLPAVDVTQPIGDDEGYPASAEIHAKLAVATKRNNQPSEAGARLRQMIPPPVIQPDEYDYPNNFSHLGGSKGEHSYIAVVHADGNGMGQRIMGIGQKHATATQNRDYIIALRHFSDAVEEAAQTSLRATLNKLASQIRGGEIRHQSLPRMKIRLVPGEQPGKLFLPFRPIVFGGDDVTFVCDGRLGLSLAVEYLKQFEQHTANLPDGKGAATACAGIAIVKSHYPFARAYKLAEDLCSSAKQYRRDKGLAGACLDWHFAMSGLFGGVEDIREREYKVRFGSLVLRPVTLAANPQQIQRSWEVVRAGVNDFQGEGWAERRNKVKALRDALRGGSVAVKSFLTKFNEAKPLPEVCSSLANLKNEGWQGGFCGYFDAVEMIDWFFPL
jgi:hypothetical protein